MVGGFKKTVEELLGLGDGSVCDVGDGTKFGTGGLVACIEDLCKVVEGQPSRGGVEAGKVEQDVGFHGSVEGETGQTGSLVEEVGPVDSAVGSLGRGVANDEIEQIHFTDDVLESADIGVGDLGAGGNVAQGGEVLEQMVGQFVTGGCSNDTFKVLGVDVAVLVFVVEVEGLADALTLKTSHHLGKLGVCHFVSLLLATNVERSPLGVEVKGDAVLAAVLLVDFLEGVGFDGAGAVDVKETEGDLILCIGFGKQVVKGSPFGHCDFASLVAVGDSKEDAILFPFDFVLDGIDTSAGWKG